MGSMKSRARRLRNLHKSDKFWISLVSAECACAALIVFAAQSSGPALSAGTSQKSSGIRSTSESAASRPAAIRPYPRLRIPKIRVDAAIEKVGLTSKGAMGIPKSPENVGWFKLGTYPGKVGSAVIDGHVKDLDGSAGVFHGLDKLAAGDKVYVHNDKNSLAVFKVTTSRTYGPKEKPRDVFNKNDGIYLNLITCSGLWDSKTKTYSKRLIIFTSAEKSEVNST